MGIGQQTWECFLLFPRFKFFRFLFIFSFPVCLAPPFLFSREAASSDSHELLGALLACKWGTGGRNTSKVHLQAGTAVFKDGLAGLNHDHPVRNVGICFRLTNQQNRTILVSSRILI